MQPEIHQKLSTALKAPAIIVGVMAVLYGLFVGVLGIGPDGPGVPFNWRIIGIITFSVGVLYLLPNRKLNSRRRLAFIYLTLTFLATISLCLTAAVIVMQSGMDSFVRDGGPFAFSVLIPLSLLAPLSLIFSMLGARDEP